MKQFTRQEPTEVHRIGSRYKRITVVKRFKDNQGLVHEFTTWGGEDTHSGAVIALTKDKKVIITYQFRPGPERWMFELPGGGIHAGEDPLVGVMRELSEETGYHSENVRELGATHRDAYINSVWHYYLAVDCEMTPEGRQLNTEEKEQGVEVKLISIEELIDNAKKDKMTDPSAVLMAYEQLKELANDK